DLFLAKPGSPAAKLSRGFKAKGTGALMRYAPPGMLALFVWNTSVAIEGTLESYNGQDLDSKLKGGVAILYGASNLLYWLGHITEAHNLQQKTKLAWLTNVILDVEQLDKPAFKSLARTLFVERWISLAKVAGRCGALLEVVLSVWTGIGRLRANDHDAAAGYFVAATGFLVFALSSTIAPMLGLAVLMGPLVAFVALFVALGGLLWAVFRTD